ncbi:hypothetical protein IP78_13695 [Brevundimonas sp. AAP58]|nr:hypothetical protein IP78_13695 [Brevundimonas sp. AAP58]
MSSALTLIPVSASAQTAAEAAVRAVYMDGIEAFNRQDLEVFLRQFGDDVEMYTPTGWLRGKAAVRERFVQTFAGYPAARMEIEELSARQVGEETVIVDFRWRAYPGGEGPAFHGLASGVYVLRGGHWVEVLEHETVTKIDPGAAVPHAGS